MSVNILTAQKPAGQLDEAKAKCVLPMKEEADKENANPFNGISDDNTELRFKKLSENAITPMRGSRNAAGFDLFSAETKEISSQGHGIVKTDIAVMLPRNIRACSSTFRVG